MLSATALATSAVLATSGATSAAVPTVESTTERVLQSVKVSMGPDGTTTGVGSSVVRTEGDVDDAEADETTYSPQEVVSDLPVRVLTSWRTSEGAGTDLSDLQGYSGRIAIDVTVQNLTVKPEMLTYDAAGTSRQQAALVGSPLSISASTSLGDVAPERIVTDDRGSGANVTNGVVGKDADGTTVQWAALLAPPILSSSTELSLVVDAKDFDVPTIDLGVQPGLVTDPSIGAMVDAAFNPARSSELELQQRTIELIGEVNLVLARASRTISDVRTSLTTTAETLGTRTVADLRASTQSVTSNMGSLDAALQSLRGELSSTLESTGSSAIAELDQAVTVVDQLLGDTSARVPTTAVRGQGCDTAVAAPKKGSSVYGNLLQVASQLDAYAKSTEACQGQLEQTILDTIGPDADQLEQQCRPDSASVTCALLETQVAFNQAATDLDAKLKEILGALDPSLYEGAVTAAEEMQTIATQIETITGAIDGRRGVLIQDMKAAYNLVRTGGSMDQSLGHVAQQLSWIHGEAVKVQEEMAARDLAARELCAVIARDTIGDDDKRALADIHDRLVTHKCGQEPETPETFPALQNVLTASDPANTTGGATEALGDVQETVDLAEAALARALLINEDGDPPGDDPDDNLNELFTLLEAQFRELTQKKADLDREIEGIKRLDTIAADIEREITAGIADIKTTMAGVVKTEADEVYTAGQLAKHDLGRMFQRSSDGLKSAGDQVVRNGKESVNEQKSAFEKARDASAGRVSGVVEDGLARINSGVSSSTRDMEAATALLTADLRRVLLDLGDRSVGGGGLLGAMATNAATAKTADFQLALAGDRATSYANVRGRDIEGLQLRQAQTDSAMQMLLGLPAFQLDLPSGSQHRTVYSFTIEDD